MAPPELCPWWLVMFVIFCDYHLPCLCILWVLYMVLVSLRVCLCLLWVCLVFPFVFVFVFVVWFYVFSSSFLVPSP